MSPDDAVEWVGRRLRLRPRPVARIARWEVLKGTDSLDRRTVAVAVLSILVASGVGTAVSSTSVSPDDGLYRIGVGADDPYYGPAASDPTFVVRPPDRAAFDDGRLEILVTDRIVVVDTRKGRAALAALRGAVSRYNDRQMEREADRSAAFPVSVHLEYVERESGTGAGGGSDAGGGIGDGGDASDDAAGTPGGTATGAGGDGPLAVPRLGGQPLFSAGQEGTPGDIAPPFPFGALVLAFLFVVPMNFVIQAYGASVLRERIDRRGELLLVAPVSPAEIVLGKTLPYLLGSLAVTVGIAWFVRGGVASVAAVVPIALLFLAATFVAAMFARSFKELTFLTVTISVGLTSYAFVPAIFAEVTPIALISPLTIVVHDLQGTPVTLGDYLFSTSPLYLSALVLFVLGVGVYREEDLFTQRPVHLKALDAFAARLRGVASVGLLTAAFIPFVLVAELLVVALLFALPLAVTLPLLFVAIALVEELAKSVHVLAGYAHGRFERTASTAVAVGVASGVGFFLGEKLTVAVQLVGLPDLAIGRAAFPTAAGVDFLPLVALLAAPLLLHTTTASLTALGASRDVRWYGAAYVLAVVVHTAYNLGVVLVVA